MATILSCEVQLMPHCRELRAVSCRSQRKQLLSLPACAASGEAGAAAAESNAPSATPTSPTLSEFGPPSLMTMSGSSPEGAEAGLLGTAPAGGAVWFRRSLGRSACTGLGRGLGALTGMRGGRLDMSSVRCVTMTEMACKVLDKHN